jgi:SAM-dependent methyltransferase
MCDECCVIFIRDNLTAEEVNGKDILDVGSLNVNGSARDAIVNYTPASYTGIDLMEGFCVDRVLPAEKLLEEYSPEAFDIVISTEMLEHCGDWRLIIHNLKTVVKRGGIILITTRSKGFPYHPWPIDHWRFELADMREIFSDFTIIALEPDTLAPGVLMKAVKPVDYVEKDLSAYNIYEIIPGQP